MARATSTSALAMILFLLTMKYVFRFKQFEVRHEVAAMKVGMDGVSLGAWAPATGRVLDVGAGCGLIGLMLAQRGAEHVTLLEIDGPTAAEARFNAEASPWTGRVTAVEGDFLEYAPAWRFDSIVSNPPFFATGMIPPDRRRAAARHRGRLTPDAFMAKAVELLAENGRVSVVLPPERLSEWTFEASLRELKPEVTCRLLTKPSAAPRRVMVTYSREGGGSECFLALNSEEYKALTSDFYL